MKAVSCRKPGYTRRPAPGRRQGTVWISVLLEPFDGLGRGQFIHRRGVDAAVDRPGHQRQAGRRGGVIVLGHQCGGRQRGHAGLADRHQVRARAHARPGSRSGAACTRPGRSGLRLSGTSRALSQSGDVDVVVGHQGAHRVAQQGREVARHRRHHQHARPRLALRRAGSAAARQTGRAGRSLFQHRLRLARAPVTWCDAPGRPAGVSPRPG